MRRKLRQLSCVYCPRRQLHGTGPPRPGEGGREAGWEVWAGGGGAVVVVVAVSAHREVLGVLGGFPAVLPAAAAPPLPRSPQPRAPSASVPSFGEAGSQAAGPPHPAGWAGRGVTPPPAQTSAPGKARPRGRPCPALQSCFPGGLQTP